MARIAYIAGYQGPNLIKKRKIIRNLTLAGSRKITLIANILHSIGHLPVIFSEAYTSERSGKLFARFSEKLPENYCVNVKYAASIDCRFANVIIGFLDTILAIVSEHNREKFDCLIIYNFSLFQVFYAILGKFFLKVPVFLEYEDDAWVDRNGNAPTYQKICKFFGGSSRKMLSGCMAVSKHLIDQIGCKNSLLIRGIVSDVIANIPKNNCKQNILLYSGSMDKSKGVDRLITAWENIEQQFNWKLIITGSGENAYLAVEASKRCKSINYMGIVPVGVLVELISKAKIGLNPHRMSNVIGNVFPFKIIEYLAAGMTILSTPMLELDNDLNDAVYFTKSDTVSDIKNGLIEVLKKDIVTNDGVSAKCIARYGVSAVKDGLKNMLASGGVQL